MTDARYGEWLQVLREKAVRHKLLFLQLGAAHEPARREALAIGRAFRGGEDYLQAQASDIGAIIVIDGIESFQLATASVTIGELRERVFDDIDRGRQFILLSRAPRAALPEVPGSSLLDDATFMHGPREDMSTHANWPTCRIDGWRPDEVLRLAVRELGPEVCASLDRALFECLLIGEDAVSVLAARELEALEGAGLISQDGPAWSWNFPKYLNPLKDALADVLAGETKPQLQLADVSRGLWEVERRIRQTIRLRAVDAWGNNWRTQCLQGDLSDKVLERATETTYLAANSIKLVRDPLEWLTLGELLGLKSRSEIGQLGLNATLWQKFGDQVLPIRNRLAHMRALHPGDATEVIKWLRVLEVKLSATS